MNRKLRYDQIDFNPVKITHRDDPLFGPVTVFHDVVIAREIIHQYDDGMAYKPGKELGAGYWTADGMWATSGGHPNTAVISTRDQIHGRTTNVRFTKSLINPDTKRPMDRGRARSASDSFSTTTPLRGLWTTRKTSPSWEQSMTTCRGISPSTTLPSESTMGVVGCPTVG